MTAAIAPGTPAPGAAAPAAPPSPAPEGVVTPSLEGGTDQSPAGDAEDDVTAARRKAREILFEGKPDPEDGGEPKPKAKVEPEKPKVEEKPKPDDDIELSRKWARYNDQNDRLVKRQKAFAAEQEEKTTALAAREEKLAAREAAMNDPVKFLAESGWTKDQIVKWIQSDGERVDPEILVKQLETKHQQQIEELRKEREREKLEYQREQEERERERRKARTEEGLNQEVKQLWESDTELAMVGQLVKKNPAKFEAFVQSRVGQVIRTVWGKTFDPETGKGQLVAPRDALLYVQAELAELQLVPGQAPAVKPATPVAVEPTPITNHATSQRTVQPVTYDESDPDARRERARRILEGTEDAE